MTPRAKDYKFEADVLIKADGTFEHFIVIRHDHEHGQVTRCCIAYEVSYLNNRRVSIVRYDDAHGVFHRHRPGYPVVEYDPTLLPDVPPHSRIDYAMNEIGAQFENWFDELRTEIMSVQQDKDND